MKTRRNIDPNEPLDKRKVLEDELKKIQEPNESFLSVQIFTGKFALSFYLLISLL